MKIFKKVIATALATTMLMSASALCADAASAEVYVKHKTYYNVYTMSTSNAKPVIKMLDTPGFKKTKYTTGSVTVSKSQSFTVNASASVDGQYEGAFANVGAKLSVGASVTTTVHAGTTISLKASSPSGVYYARLVHPRKKVNFKAKRCSLNHTGWYTRYSKTIDRVPTIGLAYVELVKS